MSINTEPLLAKAKEVEDAKAFALASRELVAAKYRLVAQGPSAWPAPESDAADRVTFEMLQTDVDSVRAADALIENRRAEFEALALRVRERSKKAKTDGTKTDEAVKPAPRRALGRKGLPKPGETAGGVA